MKRIAFSILLTFFGCVAAAAQTPGPSPTPAEDGDVVKITTALIQVDVTVTDKKGKIIDDLKPEEIEIFENGEKQKVTNFSFVSNIRSAPEVKKKGDEKAPVGPPPPMVRAETVRRSIALLVDDLTLSFESTYWVRKALKKFVDEQMQEGDLVAIVRTGAGIGALQQFTNDKRQLYAAIERVRWNTMGTGRIGTFAPLEEQDAGGAAERQQEIDDFREDIFAAGTLGAINYVVRGMSDLPGRKSILLLSHGFSLFRRDSNGLLESGRLLQNLRRLVDMANRAAVVIYTLDARGLEYTGLTAADNTSGRSFADLDQAANERSREIRDTQDGLRYLAHNTGGVPILNSNDLSGGIRKILDDQSYYLVAYEPDDSTFDPKVRQFNRLEVKVTRPGTRVRYRSGFFGVSDEKIVRPQQTAEQRLINALGSPFAINDIAIRLNALFYNTGKDGSVIRSLLHIRAQDLTFKDQPDGSKKAIFDVFAVGVGDGSTPPEKLGKTFSLTLKKDVFERAIRQGFVYDFSFPIKKSGGYQLRVALRDHGSDKLGSANQFVEVPNLKKNRLVLSGVILENMDYTDWQLINQGKPAKRETDPLTDTSLRRFRRGTVLNYGFTIMNPKQTPAGPNLSFQSRVFRDGKQIFETSLRPITSLKRDLNSADFTAALALGAEMVPGDYVLQVTIVDNLAKEKHSTATQFVQFEIIE